MPGEPWFKPQNKTTNLKKKRLTQSTFSNYSGLKLEISGRRTSRIGPENGNYRTLKINEQRAK